MATNIKDTTIASTYKFLLKRDSGTYSQTGMNVELQNDSGVALATGLYLESGATTDNVGIGVAAPAYALHIKSGGAEDQTTGGGTLALQGSDTTVIADTDLGTIYFLGSDSDLSSPPAVGAKIMAEATGVWDNGDANDAPTALKFFTCDDNTSNTIAQRMVIRHNGYVGINTESPDYWFQVSAGSDGDAAGFYSSDDCVRIILEDDDTSHNMYIGHSSDNNCAFIGYAGGTGTATGNLNINRDGHVGIGTTPNSTFPLDVRTNTASQYAALFVNNGDNANRYGIKLQCGASGGGGTTYYMRCDDGGGTPIGYIAQDGADLKFIQDSDIRLKKDVIDTTIKGLDTINAIKVRDFKWKRNNISAVAGFIANELKTVFPSAVVGTEDAMEDILDDDGKKTGERIAPMGVAKQELVPVLIKAVQELSAKVTALESA
tara:strand:+ start:4331 stop:5626 length:1296 start_codon:yes stop_codon:yes gene_type:complete